MDPVGWMSISKRQASGRVSNQLDKPTHPSNHHDDIMYRFRRIHGLVYEHHKEFRREEVQIASLRIDEPMDIPVFESFLEAQLEMKTVVLDAGAVDVKVYMQGNERNDFMKRRLGLECDIRGDFVAFSLRKERGAEKLMDVFVDEIAGIEEALKRYVPNRSSDGTN